MRRHGNVCDTLVFCLVATLIPAWLLGHLFLTFFPASASTTESKLTDASIEIPSQSDVSFTPAGKTPDRTEDAAHLNDQFPTEKLASNGASEAEWRQESAALQTAVEDFKSKNHELNVKTNQLESQKSKLAAEISKLKNQLAQVSNVNGSQNMNAGTDQLQSMKSDYSQLDRNYRSLEQAKASLESKMEQLESENQQLAMEKETFVNEKDGQRELETRAQRLQQQLQETKNNLAEQRQLVLTMQAAKSNSESSRTKVAAQEQSLEEAIAQKDSLQARVTKLTGDLESANSSLATRTKELAEFREQLQISKSKYMLAIKRLALAESDGKPASKSVSTASKQPSELELNGPSGTKPTGREEYREYVSSLGNRSKLAFVQWVGDDQVIIRSFANKRLYQLPLSRFSQADQQYLLSLKTAVSQ